MTDRRYENQDRRKHSWKQLPTCGPGSRAVGDSLPGCYFITLPLPESLKEMVPS